VSHAITHQKPGQEVLNQDRSREVIAEARLLHTGHEIVTSSKLDKDGMITFTIPANTSGLYAVRALNQWIKDRGNKLHIGRFKRGMISDVELQTLASLEDSQHATTRHVSIILFDPHTRGMNRHAMSEALAKKGMEFAQPLEQVIAILLRKSWLTPERPMTEGLRARNSKNEFAIGQAPEGGIASYWCPDQNDARNLIASSSPKRIVAA